MADLTSRPSLDLLAAAGLGALRHDRIKEALDLLEEAYAGYVEEGGQVPPEVLAAYGFCLVVARGRCVEGLRLCKRAAYLAPDNAEIQLFLARASLAEDERKQAVTALDLGLSLDPRDPKLLALRLSLGARRRPVIAALHRDHPINIWLGRLRQRFRGPLNLKAGAARGTPRLPDPRG